MRRVRRCVLSPFANAQTGTAIRRAAWAPYRDNDFELHRSEYDVERAVRGATAVGDERLARTYESASR